MIRMPASVYRALPAMQVRIKQSTEKVALAAATLCRNELYRDSTAMYRDIVAKSPRKL